MLRDTLKHIVEPAYKLLYALCIVLFRLLPVKRNKIVFIQGCGGGYRCNLKYVAEEIKRRQLPCDMVWIVESMSTDIPSFIRKVKYNRISAVYELATAKVMINNTKASYPVRKKAQQTFIYIPHGQPGCKCAEGDAIISEEYKAVSKAHSALTDIFVSMGKYHTQVLKDTFWIPENAQIWETGFPRNDNYYIDTKEKQSELRRQLGITDDTHIVFYAPTFREHSTPETYNLDLHRVLEALEKRTGEHWIMFITLHPCFRWFDKPAFNIDEKVRDMTAYGDIHELLLIAEIAISDYSSVALDFANTGRPVFLYAPDIKYYSKERGLKDMYFKLPFALSRNNDEMEEAIMKFNPKEYEEKIKDFNNSLYHSVDDGHAAERFVMKLKTIMG